MVHLSKLKALPHWAYLGCAGFLGAYSYSYFHAGHPLWTDAARFGVFPLLQASGALGWAKARAIRLAQPFRGCPLRRLAA